MSNIDFSRARATVEYDGFGGINSSGACSAEGSIKNMSDFRLCFDGALEKRQGFELFASLSDAARAIYQATENTLLVLVGCNLYSVDLTSREMKYLSMVGTSSGRASFLSFGGNIYLADGANVYVFRDNALFEANGYSPLYGKDWHQIQGGEMLEAFNMLSSHARLSFRIADDISNAFYLPFEASAIDAVYINGIPAHLSDFDLEDEGRTVFSSSGGVYESGDEVLFFFSVSNMLVNRYKIAACKSFAAYGDGSEGTDHISVAFYDGADPNLIYPSTPVSRSELSVCEDVYPNISNIYVIEKNAIAANDGQGNITDVCQKDDGLMVFTADRAFMLRTDSSGQSSLSRVSLGTGCSSPFGATISDDTPITVSYYGIFKWDPVSYEEGEYRATCISGPIRGLLSESFFKSAVAHHYRKKSELWFCDPKDPSGTVFIYSIDAEAWFTFSGIGAERFFEYGGEIGFFRGDSIYLFSSERAADLLSDGEGADMARLESGRICFDPHHKKRRLYAVMLRTSPGASLLLTVTDSKGRSASYPLSDSSGDDIGHIEQRISLGRSEYYSFTVEAYGNTVIYGITLAAAS